MKIMSESFKSIIIPMNPRGSYSGGSTPGSIIANKWFADHNGGVIISYDQGRKNGKYPGISLGYFYDSEKHHKVTHRFTIVKMTNYDGLSESDVQKYLPGWRLDLRNEGRRNRQIWLLIKDIFELEKPEELSSFGRKRCQSYVYSDKELHLPFKMEKTSPDKFIDDVIWRCAVSKKDKLTEKDLELILWAYVVKSGATYLDRQLSVDEKILDIFLKTPQEEFIVIELKLDTADSKALAQIRDYIEKMKRKWGITKIKGVIMGKEATSDLLSKLENTDISFEQYEFKFNSRWVQNTLFQHTQQ